MSFDISTPRMTPTTLGTLILLPAGAAVAWVLGGRAGTGVLSGVLLGAAIALSSAAYQRYAAHARPALVLPAFALSFLVKLAALVGFAVLFRYVDFAQARVDWRHFAGSFALASVVLLFISAPEAARALKTR